ncbi:MAG TPA: ACT domain-containing protein [Methylomirabilota bacterium]|nr:ACT domain-containing protein [Methylomirabilota bacterium]
MAKTTQLTITAQSKPGVLGRVARALAQAGVNINAVCAAESGGRGKLRLLVSDPARAKTALAAAKIRCGEEPALVLTLEDRPGALAEVAEKLGRAKINVKCAYATTAGAGPCQVVLAVANSDKAERALA